jgi:hypothetical protein
LGIAVGRAIAIVENRADKHIDGQPILRLQTADVALWQTCKRPAASNNLKRSATRKNLLLSRDQHANVASA